MSRLYSSSLAENILVLIKLAATDTVVIFSAGVVMEKQSFIHTQFWEKNGKAL